MSRRLKVSVEEKMRCIKSYMSGKGNLETIAGRAGVDEKSLRNWIKRYKAGGGRDIPTVQSGNTTLRMDAQ